MTKIDPSSDAPARPVSMNDTLPSGNPSLRTVLIAFAVIAAVVIAFTFRSHLGF